MFTLIYIRFFYISILLFALLYFKFSAGGTMYVKFSLFYVLFIYLLLANVFLFIVTENIKKKVLPIRFYVSLYILV